MSDITKMREDAQRKIARQKEALQTTLDDLKFAEEIQAKNPTFDFSGAIANLRVKRDRQNKAFQATEQLLQALDKVPLQETTRKLRGSNT